MSVGYNMQVPMAQIRVLGDQEDQQTIQDWFNQVTAVTRASRAWGDYLDAEWTAHSEEVEKFLRTTGPILSNFGSLLYTV